MSLETDLLDTLIKSAEREIAEGMGSSKAQPFWMAARDALDAVKLDKDAVIEYGTMTFRNHLGFLAAAHADTEARIIRNLTGGELVDSMRSGAEELSQDTARREEARRKVLDLLAKLGTIGARMLIGLL